MSEDIKNMIILSLKFFDRSGRYLELGKAIDFGSEVLSYEDKMEYAVVKHVVDGLGDILKSDVQWDRILKRLKEENMEFGK